MPTPGSAKWWTTLVEPLGRRNEVGVEDGDELAFGGFEARFQGSGFEAVAVGAVKIVDGLGLEARSAGSVAGDRFLRDLDGFVGGVVEQLDFKPVAGVIDAADGVEQAVDDELLVINGELDGDEGKCRFFERRLRLV